MSTEVLYDAPSRADGTDFSAGPDYAASGVSFTTAITGGGTDHFLVQTTGGVKEYYVPGVKPYAGIEVASSDFAFSLDLLSVDYPFEIILRASAFTVSGSWSGYSIKFYGNVGSTGAVTWAKVTSGSYGAETSTGGGVWSYGDRVTVWAQGTTFGVAVNGRTVLTFTDSSFSGTKIMLTAQHNTVAVRFRNLAVATIGAQATTYPYSPDIGWRMPWHIDGSVGASQAGTMTAQQMLDANDENDAIAYSPAVTNGGVIIQVTFPEPRVLTGIFAAFDASVPSVSGCAFQYLGLDGVTWTQGFQDLAVPGTYINTFAMTSLARSVSTNWRTTISNGFQTYPGSIRGVRIVNGSPGFSYNYPLDAFHLYGYIPAGSGVHRLRLWHPHLDIPLSGAYFDLDDIASSSVRTRDFRIKNISTALTANSISVDVQSPLYGTTLTNQFGLRKASDTPGVYVPTLTITSLASGALSEVLTWRRTTPTVQPSRIETPFVRMQTGSFT